MHTAHHARPHALHHFFHTITSTIIITAEENTNSTKHHPTVGVINQRPLGLLHATGGATAIVTVHGGDARPM